MDVLISNSISAKSLQITNVSNTPSLQLAEGSLIEATVQRVVDSMVLLNVQGKLLSARTEIPLKAQQPVLLEVAQANSTQITLRVLGDNSSASAGTETIGSHNLQSLLTSWGLEANEDNIAIARALLTHSHMIKPEAIKTIHNLWQTISLNASFDPSEKTANLEALVYLHTNQLPVNEESLSMARHWLNSSSFAGNPTVRVAQGLAELQSAMKVAVEQLQAMSGTNPRLNQLLTVLQSSLAQMSTWPISPDTPIEQMVARLADLIPNLGTPPEAELANVVKDTNHSPTRQPAKPVTENNVQGAKAGAGQTDASLSNTIDLKDIANTSVTSGRASLEVLSQSLSKGDLTNPLYRLASVIAEVLADKNLEETTLQGTRTTEVLRHLVDRLESISKDLGAIQLSNLATSPTPAFEECYLFPIPLATADGATTAHLKVFRRPGQQAVDPDNVRLALLLDLPELGEIAINFNVFEKRLSGQILSERERTHQRVKSGLNELHHRLNDLGYWIDSLTCDLFSDQEETPLATNNEIKAPENILSRVNVRA